MKKICLILVFLLIISIPNLALASDVQIKVIGNDNEKKLEYIVGGEKINFDEAKSKYGVNDYYRVLTSEGEFYFYKGNQINENEYVLGLDNLEADKRTSLYEKNGIRVHNTEDIINNINNLYLKRMSGEFHLIYSHNEYLMIDFNQINNFVSDNYLIDKNQNIFKYREHGIFNYPRFLYNYDEYEMIVNVSPIISLKEEERISEFMNAFKKDLNEKSDYEKILYAYTYLSKTITKKSDCAANVSAYNALIDRNAGCIGKSNAFGYMMDYLGIEAYIANNSVFKDDKVVSTHTFNIVKLNNQYYIVDLTIEGFDGLLKTNNENIIFSNGIKISEMPYVKEKLNTTINYDKYDSLVDEIRREAKKEESEESKDYDLKDVNFLSYLILVLILLVLTFIIILFTRKK